MSVVILDWIPVLHDAHGNMMFTDDTISLQCPTPQAGNTIYNAGCDGQACTLKEVPQDGFGPRSWA